MLSFDLIFSVVNLSILFIFFICFIIFKAVILMENVQPSSMCL